jgi:hypothetical protein
VRRPTSFVAIVALSALVGVTTGCGRDDTTKHEAAAPSTTSPGPAAEDDPGPTTTVAVAGPDPGASTSTTGARAPRGATPTTTAAPGEPTASRPDATNTAPTPADDGHLGPPGAFARTLLRPQAAAAIALERQQQSGAAPAAASFAFARDTLQNVTAKSVAAPAVVGLAGGSRAWTADDIRSLADASAHTPQGGATAVVRLLFLRGTFEGSEDVLGVTVRGDVVAIFTDAVAGATTPVLSGDTIEEAVLVHELGHVLGLVDLARDTGRADHDHPGHSTNPKSVMYWAVESSLVGQVLTGPPPRQFDADDLADLHALRDGA